MVLTATRVRILCSTQSLSVTVNAPALLQRIRVPATQYSVGLGMAGGDLWVSIDLPILKLNKLNGKLSKQIHCLLHSSQLEDIHGPSMPTLCGLWTEYVISTDYYRSISDGAEETE